MTTNYYNVKHTFKEAQLSPSVIDSYEGFIYVNIALQILGITAALLALVPSVKNNQKRAKEKREYIIPIIIWCILVLIYSAVFMMWIYVVLPIRSVLIIQIGISINVVLILWGFLVNLSYYQLLKENNGMVLYAAPSNIPMQNVIQQQHNNGV